MKKVSLLILGIVAILCFTGCNSKPVESGEKEESGNSVVQQPETNLETNDKYASIEKNPIATMEMENGDVVKIELYPKVAPTTVENFIDLVEKGFYDGLTFHRVIPTFMAQGGDPSGDGTGRPGYSIKGEFSGNNFKNDIKHEIGVISMARANDPNSAGSQFFIVTDENSYLSLDGSYAAFGKVIEGMDSVYTIVNTPVIRDQIDEEVLAEAYRVSYEIQSTGSMNEEQQAVLAKYYDQQAELNRPTDPPKIRTITVETFGVEYDEPQKIQ